MGRLSIARSLRLLLAGLTVLLAVVAGLGVGRLLSARQKYEDTLASSSGAAVAAARLDAAGAQERALLAAREVAGVRLSGAGAARAFSAAAATAQGAAEGDRETLRTLRQEIRLEVDVRRLGLTGRLDRASFAAASSRAIQLANALSRRQTERLARARRRNRSDSRTALLLVIAAGMLALLSSLALVGLVVRRMRAPLDELVAATQALAGGQNSRRVNPAGPAELRDLGQSFNAMADSLATARARVEEQRRRLHVTISSLGDALLVTEPGSSRIAVANPRASELVPELPVGSPVDDPDGPLPDLERALAGEVLVEHSGRALSVTAAQLGENQEGVVWTIRDVSGRVRLERAKSEFVATASHELRSPLTSIKGFVELLARSPENMTARQREFIDIVLRSTDRLVELVGDLLDVARIEADRVELDRRPVDVGEAVREVTLLMGPRLEEKDQQLELYVAPMLPLALADAGRVRQIVANLLTNAHLYTPEGGRISLGVEPDRAWVQLTVADTGVGMSAAELEHVFERFYRSPERSKTTSGTGLGLSIVKSLVELHAGHVEVESAPGRGTTFRVRLPAALPGVESVASMEAVRGRRVLIVDDEREVAELIAGQLAPLDVESEILTDAAQVLPKLRDGNFDAMTLDIFMPGTDGMAVLNRVRSDPQLRQIPIVFVSVFSGRQELAGEWAVSKPIDADELRTVLGAAIRAGRSRILVVGRAELAPLLEPALADLGIEHQWETSGAAAARVCGELRFELALIDVGIRNPQAVLQALDLRGRRLRRAVILFSDGETEVPPGIERLGIEVVPVDHAPVALLAALRGTTEP